MPSDGPIHGAGRTESGDGEPTEWDPFAGQDGSTAPGSVAGPSGFDEQPTVVAGPEAYAAQPPPPTYGGGQVPPEGFATQAYAGAPGGPEKPSSKRGLVIAIIVLAVALVLIAVVLAFTMGRGGSPTTTASPPPSPTASPSPSPTPSPSPSPSPSPTPSPSPSPTRTGAASPADAAQGLYAARIDDNRDRAKQFATQTAINQMWGNPISGYSYMGCDREGSRYICSYYAEGSAISMRVEGSDSAGWKVTTVNFIAD